MRPPASRPTWALRALLAAAALGPASALPARDIAAKMIDATTQITHISKDFGKSVLTEELTHFVSSAEQLLETYLSEAKLERQKMNAQRNNADVTRKTADKEIEIQVKDMNDAKEDFVQFLSGVQSGALSGDDGRQQLEQQANQLQAVLSLISGQPGAGVLKGAIEQMIQDSEHEGEDQAEKSAEIAALTQDAVKKIQQAIDLSSAEIDLLLEKKTNATERFFRSKYVSEAIDSVLALSREDLTLFEELEVKVTPMARRNVEKVQVISDVAMAAFKLAKEVETYQMCVANGGNSPDHCLGVIGRDYSSGMPDPNAAVSFVGCFEDRAQRAMPVKIPGGFTVGKCEEACREHSADMKFFAVQYGSECFCGDGSRGFDQYGEKPETDCQGPAGSPKCIDTETDKFCGGPWRNAVYTVGTGGGSSATAFLHVHTSKTAAKKEKNKSDHSFLQLKMKRNDPKRDVAVARRRLEAAMKDFTAPNPQRATPSENLRPDQKLISAVNLNFSPILRAVEDEAENRPASSAGPKRTSQSLEAVPTSASAPDADDSRLQLATSVLRQVGRALRNAPELEAFANRMLHTRDKNTNVNALNLFASQLRGSSRQTASSRRTSCSPEALDSAREKVTTALDVKLAKEKALVDLKGKDAVVKAVTSVSESSKGLEANLFALGGSTWKAVDERCHVILDKLDEEREKLFGELGELINAQTTTGSAPALLQKSKTFLNNFGRQDADPAAAVPLPAPLAAEVTQNVQHFEKEVSDLRDHLSEQCMNHAIEILHTLEAHLDSATYQETVQGPGADEVAAAEAAVVEAANGLQGARKDFDDLAASCPGSQAATSGAVSLQAVEYAKELLVGGGASGGGENGKGGAAARGALFV